MTCARSVRHIDGLCDVEGREVPFDTAVKEAEFRTETAETASEFNWLANRTRIGRFSGNASRRLNALCQGERIAAGFAYVATRCADRA
jgi:hypothetical protein